MKYHGHQFRHYNPNLGDGRGFLFAQFSNGERLMDLGTKGSGQTIYSRSGDGRLTLKGAYREILATEYLKAQNVDTSETFSVIETGESLQRNDEPSPTRAAVLVRYSHSHIRIGSFQRLKYRRDDKNIEKLLIYVCENYYKDINLDREIEFIAKDFLRDITAKLAKTCSEWIGAGFVHGVLNTDNINVTGESFDYGPYRFLDTCDPKFTAAYFDQTGLYAYGQQANAVYWNLYQLAHCFESFEKEKGDFDGILKEFPKLFEKELSAYTLRKLGLRSSGDLEKDAALKDAFFYFLTMTEVKFEQTFFDFYASKINYDRHLYSAQKDLYKGEHFEDFYSMYKCFEPISERLHPYFERDHPCSLIIDEIESIWKYIEENDDWSVFESKLEDIRYMAEAYNLEETNA